MILTLARFSRTTYRGALSSGSGSSSKMAACSSPKSRSTLRQAIASGQLQNGHNVPKSLQKTARTLELNVQHEDHDQGMRCINKAVGLGKYVRCMGDDAIGVFGRKPPSEMASVASLRLQMEQLGLVQTFEQERLAQAKTQKAAAVSCKKNRPSRSARASSTAAQPASAGAEAASAQAAAAAPASPVSEAAAHEYYQHRSRRAGSLSSCFEQPIDT
ncbi:hypothetical protein K437DRAFT_283929 [Tilletiaria anomala UBC 951]|uniref:Uncharacterized protein n=1 Tax=Tilletiaria anomala (strain ATCC 24038 / CBS 436.72 / UBC 951) TaxID=1037660 RepID=A0A066V923_TILAU|nr:uncharacterized protein K437DRAFT_283929 [Tilletiaria anomala UBC 951]KDN35105.1 hypothetical protein K437DRAFT_283929 [Tilletiaria anomala UBC 951]